MSKIALRFFILVFRKKSSKRFCGLSKESQNILTYWRPMIFICCYKPFFLICIYSAAYSCIFSVLKSVKLLIEIPFSRFAFFSFFLDEKETKNQDKKMLEPLFCPPAPTCPTTWLQDLKGCDFCNFQQFRLRSLISVVIQIWVE